MKNDAKVRLIQFPEYEVEILERYSHVFNMYEYYIFSSTSNSYEYAFGVERRFTKPELKRIIWEQEDRFKELFFNIEDLEDSDDDNN